MLKRFFLGLLILSALTSEGIVNLPGNIYNLYICSSSGTGLSDGRDMGLEQQGVGNSRTLFCGALSKGILALSLNNPQKFKIKAFLDNCILPDRPSFESLAVNSYSAPDFEIKKEAVMQRSDMSPPAKMFRA